jgi:hypothetical protein
VTKPAEENKRRGSTRSLRVFRNIFAADENKHITPITPSTASALLLLRMKFRGGAAARFLPLLAATKDIADWPRAEGVWPASVT